MSAAGRKAISEATKKCWAMKRAEAASKPIGAAKAAAAKKAAGKKSGKKKQKTSEATAPAAAQ